MSSDDIKIPVKLFVSKFPATMSEDELREVCSSICSILYCFEDFRTLW